MVVLTESTSEVQIEQKNTAYESAKSNWINTKKDSSVLLSKKSELIETYVRYNQIDKAINVQKEVVGLGFGEKAQYDILADLYTKQNSSAIKIYTGNNEIKKSTSPVMKDWYVFVPASVLSDNFGAKITLKSNGNSIDIAKGNSVVSFDVGVRSYKVNNQQKAMNTAAFKQNSEIYVPMPILAKDLGYKFEWNNKARLAVVNAK